MNVYPALSIHHRLYFNLTGAFCQFRCEDARLHLWRVIIYLKLVAAGNTPLFNLIKENNGIY